MFSLKFEIRITFTSRPRIKSFFNRFQVTNGQYVSKKIHTLSKPYSIYEEVRKVADRTDIDSYFHHNICDISQSHHRIVRVSRGSNKNKFAINIFRFCDIKTQQPQSLKKISISRKEIVVPLDKLRKFRKAYEQACKSTQIPLPRPKIENSSSMHKTTYLLKAKKIFEHSSTVKNVYLLVSSKIKSVSFPSKIPKSRRPTDSSKDCKNYTSQNLQESMSYWLQVRILCKQLWHLESSQQEKQLVTRTVPTKTAIEKCVLLNAHVKTPRSIHALKEHWY